MSSNNSSSILHFHLSIFNFPLKVAPSKNLGAFIIADHGYGDLDIEFKFIGIEIGPAAAVVFDTGIIVF